jgi:hypothetical protein
MGLVCSTPTHVPAQVHSRSNHIPALAQPPSQVKRIHVVQRENPIVNRLNKTKVEKHPNLQQEKEDRLRELRQRERAAHNARQKEEQRVARERKEKAYQRDHAYDDIFSEENMAQSSNQDRSADWEDDFM